MAKNLDKVPEHIPGRPPTNGLTKFRTLNWKDEDQITNFMVDVLSVEEQERLRMYIRTLVEDETLDLSNFEIKRIAVAMLALDRGDNWFFTKGEDSEFHELSIELQKFLQGKEEMVIDTIRKAKVGEKKPKSLWDQLDTNFKSYEIKAEGSVEGVDYIFETKKKAKPKMLTVVVKEEKDGNDKQQQEADESEEETKDENKE